MSRTHNVNPLIAGIGLGGHSEVPLINYAGIKNDNISWERRTQRSSEVIAGVSPPGDAGRKVERRIDIGLRQLRYRWLRTRHYSGQY